MFALFLITAMRSQPGGAAAAYTAYQSHSDADIPAPGAAGELGSAARQPRRGGGGVRHTAGQGALDGRAGAGQRGRGAHTPPLRRRAARPGARQSVPGTTKADMEGLLHSGRRAALSAQ